jgi:hypothetical protein
MESIELYRRTIKYHTGVPFFDIRFKERDSLIIDVNYSGIRALGEIPLYPDCTFLKLYGNISSIIASNTIRNIKHILTEKLGIFDNIKEEISIIQLPFLNCKESNLPSNILFGINSVLLDYYNKKLSLYTSFSINNYIFINEISEIKAHIDQSKSASPIKIKYDNSPNFMNNLNELYSKYKRNFILDFNRRFSFESASMIFKIIDYNIFEYIEEPCDNAYDSASLAKNIGIPIAWDETIIANELDDNLISQSTALILKPALIGDFTYIINLAYNAMKCGKKIIFSSAYESDIGVYSIALLANFLGVNNAYHGLNVSKFINTDGELDNSSSLNNSLFFNTNIANY